MKISLLLFFLALAWTTGVAQNRKQIDSLLTLLDTQIPDSSKLKIYNKIGHYYRYDNTEKAIGYFEKAEKISVKLNLPSEIAKNKYNIGYCYYQKGNYNKSLDYYFQSARLFDQVKDRENLANVFMSIATVYFDNTNFKKTDEYYDKAQRLIESLSDSLLLSDLFSSKGHVYDKRGLYDISLQYAQKAYKLAVMLNDNYRIVSLLSDIGLIYKHQKKTTKALAQFDSALIFLKKTKSDPVTLASIYNNIGATHAQAGNYLLANKAFSKSISIASEAEIPFIVMENYRNLSDMYGDTKNFELQANYLKKYYTIKDSLFTTENRNQLTQLEADYEIDQKNTQIIKQEREVEKQKNQRNIFIIIALAAACLLTTLGIFYGRIRKTYQLLEEKNDQINTQKDELQTVLNDLKNTQEELIRQGKLASVGQLTKGIVDRIQNPLNYVGNFSQLSEGVLDNLVAILDKQKDVLPPDTMDDVLDEANMLKSNLIKIQTHSNSTTRILKDMQKLLKEKSRDFLEIDLNSFMESKARASLQEIKSHGTNFTVNLVLNLDNTPVRTNLLPYEFGQVVQNMVSNSHYALHEKSKLVNGFQPEIKIGTESRNDHVLITFRDNGKGILQHETEKLFSPFFTTKPTSEGTGLGLYMIKDIIEIHKGKIEIISQEGEYTEITILLPAVTKP